MWDLYIKKFDGIDVIDVDIYWYFNLHEIKFSGN